MKISSALLGLALLTGAQGAELKPETLRAWNQYVHDADSAMRARLEPGRHFLWTDEAPDRAARVRKGEILIAPMDGAGMHHVPDGLIHHWVGAMFIPDATLDGVLAVAHDYDRYKDIYRPKVLDSRLLACGDGRQEYSMVWMNNIVFVNATLQSHYEAHDFRVDRQRSYTITHVTGAQEIEDYGKSGERLLPAGEGNGFIWRLQSIARYQERDGGVYLELEAIGLTRDIPATIRWMTGPLVTRLSRGTLAASLRQTREGVAASARATQALTACSMRGSHPAAIAVAEEDGPTEMHR
ncbi:MAG: hypothetical protein P4L56_00740 [Candidatus Sulfopaludibacter sp.]|nr:hypothetical protein [Candidatus Sulfopaludibacter sp.]